MKTQAQIWEEWTAPETLQECVRLFIEILEIEEYNDDGDRKFRPNVISSCRVWDTHRMNRVLKKMKELSED